MHTPSLKMKMVFWNLARSKPLQVLICTSSFISRLEEKIWTLLELESTVFSNCITGWWKFKSPVSSFSCHDLVEFLMLMILISLEFELVRNCMRYDELKFVCAKCFPSICFVHGELGLIIVRFMILMMRRFQWYMICWFLENLFMHRRRTHRGRRWKPPSSAVYNYAISLGFACTKRSVLCCSALEPHRPLFDSPCVRFHFPINSSIDVKCCVSLIEMRLGP